MVPTDQFEVELQVFNKHRREWSRSHPGAFVVIQDEIVAEGFFETYGEALKAGLTKFGVNRSFLVKQVWVTEPVYCIS
jgi:hypothetical protein